MNIFCSYAFTGEKESDVAGRMEVTVNALTEAGHHAYCPLFDPQKNNIQGEPIKGIFEYVLPRIAEADALLVVVPSPRRSEGQLIEVGAALMLQKPVYLFQHASAAAAPSHLPKLATQTYVWDDLEDLANKLIKVESKVLTPQVS
jgi:nucleoside 2-deoxyribosyltransferase